MKVFRNEKCSRSNYTVPMKWNEYAERIKDERLPWHTYHITILRDVTLGVLEREGSKGSISLGAGTRPNSCQGRRNCEGFLLLITLDENKKMDIVHRNFLSLHE
jgi:hypothetical protein